MKTRSTGGGLVLAVWAAGYLAVMVHPATGGDVIQFGDVAATKQKAEAGDVRAQLALADSLVNNQRPAAALEWYRQASERGSIEGKYRAGALLLFGDASSPPSQLVTPKPAEGAFLTYQAATNGHVEACINLSRALQRGLGVNTNLVEAYAWLHMFAVSNIAQVRAEMNFLALKLRTQQIQEAQILAREFRNHRWPALALRKPPEDSPAPQAPLPFKVNGITLGGRIPLAIINHRTLAEGETASISLADRKVNIKCLKISQDSVLIEIEGEDEPLLLGWN